MAAALKLVCVLVLCMLVVEPMATSALTCGDVNSKLSPCLSYLMNGGNSKVPPSGCCNGVRDLNTDATTTADRRTVCNCLKSVANTLSPVQQNLAAGIPGKCNVNIPYKISTSTDCNKVQ